MGVVNHCEGEDDQDFMDCLLGFNGSPVWFWTYGDYTINSL